MSGEELRGIYAEARQYAEDERNNPPLACPEDGEPLQEGPRGVLFCKFDGYRWPRDGRW